MHPVDTPSRVPARGHNRPLFVWVALISATLLLTESAISSDKKPAPKAAAPAAEKNADGWISLFDGKTLKGWKKSDFGGDGKIEVKDGTIVLGVGGSMTGITIDRKIPRMDYEVEYEGRRVDGTDFFCGLTFPVGKEHCSLILGGWGGKRLRAVESRRERRFGKRHHHLRDL